MFSMIFIYFFYFYTNFFNGFWLCKNKYYAISSDVVYTKTFFDTTNHGQYRWNTKKNHSFVAYNASATIKDVERERKREVNWE